VAAVDERVFVFRIEFWMSFAGLLTLVVGLISTRKQLAAGPPLAKLIALGPVFVAAPFAAFAAEHFVIARSIAEIVPAWLPDRLFWAYFVGCALLAAAISLALEKEIRWSGPLVALMFFIFVATIHIPNVVRDPHNRIAWAIMLRDNCYACGGLILTAIARQPTSGLTLGRRYVPFSRILIHIARTFIAIALAYFAAQHFLHPEFAPGVPDLKLTPVGVPFRLFLADLVGAILLVAGVALLINQHARLCATMVGLTMTLLTLFLFTPIMFAEWGTPLVIDGINFVADTLLYAGIMFLLAAAMPASERPEKPILNRTAATP
jgi:uncharacterized membrane protein YphA (DoxX/SURF4 family)